MHHTVSQTPYLHVFDVDSGLWLDTMLGSVVSPHILEAMNLILLKDGILAFIGTRLEFGHYVVQLGQRPLGDSTACWISLPASTIMSMLGLSLSIVESEKPEMVFHGSPLTVALALILWYRDNPPTDVWLGNHLDPHIRMAADVAFHPNHQVLLSLGIDVPLVLFASELNQALSYLYTQE